MYCSTSVLLINVLGRPIWLSMVLIHLLVPLVSIPLSLANLALFSFDQLFVAPCLSRSYKVSTADDLLACFASCPDLSPLGSVEAFQKHVGVCGQSFPEDALLGGVLLVEVRGNFWGDAL